MSSDINLSNNSLAFIALSNEYCQAIENNSLTDRDEFIDSMLRLLPRLYISASDLNSNDDSDEAGYIDDSLTEDEYNEINNNLSSLLGEDDTYLEAFEEDMKYSDTPIAASIAEGLCDIFQVLYNFLEAVKNTTNDNIKAALYLVSEDFRQYWSRPLCNVLRALNRIKYQQY